MTMTAPDENRERERSYPMQHSHLHNTASPELCQAFASLFKGREDAWGGVEGICHHEPVSLQHYSDHLKGITSLGIYPLLDDGTCFWSAIDLDVKDFNKAKQIRDALVSGNIPTYIASSKSKGYHCFCFAEEVFDAKEIRSVLNYVLKELGIKAEIFPKQNEVTKVTPLGNYINLPCFGTTRLFLTRDFKEVPLEVAIGKIKYVQQEAIERILRSIPKEPPKKERKAKREGKKHPPCIDAILEGVTEPGRDEAAFALVRYYLSGLKYSTSDTLELLRLWDQRNNPPLGEQTVDAKVKSAEKGYEFGCGSIRDNPMLSEFCVGEEECEWWKEVKEKKSGLAIDGVTYYQREKQILSSRPGKKEDSFPIITTLSNFSIEPKLKIELEGEDERLDTAIKTDRGEYSILFKKGDFNSRKQLLSALPVVDLEYYGADKDTQPILALLNKEELPKRKGTKTLGRDGDLWVVKDMVISKDGIVEDPKIMYVPSGLDFERRIHYSSHNGNTDEILKYLVGLNEQAAILPILGWFFATPFTPLIRERLHHFPLLLLWGTHGAGKSSLLELLYEVFGLEPVLHSAVGTRFTLLRLLSATNSIPVVLDEIKTESMEAVDIKRLINLLRRAYGGEVEERGKANLSTEGYHIQAPVVAAGEAALTSKDTALSERCIQVNLNPNNLIGNSSYIKAFRNLKDINKRGFAFNYIKWCLNADLSTLMDEARTYLPEDLKKGNERIRDNIQVMITGLLALRDFSGNTQFINGKGIDIAIMNEREELLGEKGYSDIALTTFLETLATMAQTNRIRAGMHYMVGEYNTCLYIHLEDCLAEFRKFLRETNKEMEVLDKKAYRKQAREMLEKGNGEEGEDKKGYVLSLEEQKWFPSSDEDNKGKNRMCLLISIKDLPFEASGFYRPTIQGQEPLPEQELEPEQEEEPIQEEGIDMTI